MTDGGAEIIQAANFVLQRTQAAKNTTLLLIHPYQLSLLASSLYRPLHRPWNTKQKLWLVQAKSPPTQVAPISQV